jgi:4a-hydroxytetrahydrobiopterin dehydratase
MAELATKKCVPCHGGVSALAPESAKKLLGQLASGWQLIEDGRAIRREFKFTDFYRTMSFVNALAHIANLEDHHPDLAVGYDYCHVRFQTHAIGGLHENDFICAARIDALSAG